MADEADFDALDNERKGAIAGLNPMFGEWQHTFRFAPLPHGSKGPRRQAFREAIQAELNNKWIYSHDVQVTITLHLDTQDVLETSDAADLDNYAKAIIDGLKGSGGIMFDDTQVQALKISWFDNYDPPSFTVETRSAPDDFVLKPVEFYEMPDGLWYPIESLPNEADADTIFTAKVIPVLLVEMICSVKRNLRVKLRNKGVNRRSSFHRSKWMQAVDRGYHRSRIQDCGFIMHERGAWQDDIKKWKKNNPSKLQFIDETINGMRMSWERLDEYM